MTKKCPAGKDVCIPINPEQLPWKCERHGPMLAVPHHNDERGTPCGEGCKAGPGKAKAEAGGEDFLDKETERILSLSDEEIWAQAIRVYGNEAGARVAAKAVRNVMLSAIKDHTIRSLQEENKKWEERESQWLKEASLQSDAALNAEAERDKLRARAEDLSSRLDDYQENNEKLLRDLISVVSERDELQEQVKLLVEKGNAMQTEIFDAQECESPPERKQAYAWNEILSNLPEEARKQIERVKGVTDRLKRTHDFIQRQPDNCLGAAPPCPDATHPGYWYRDEVLDELSKMINLLSNN